MFNQTRMRHVISSLPKTVGRNNEIQIKKQLSQKGVYCLLNYVSEDFMVIRFHTDPSNLTAITPFIHSHFENYVTVDSFDPLPASGLLPNISIMIFYPLPK
jgi:hypothetical protein